MSVLLRALAHFFATHPLTRLLTRLAWSMVKRVLHAASGLSEIERICSAPAPAPAGGAAGPPVAGGHGGSALGLPPHTPAMTLAFYASVVGSRQLRSAATALSSATSSSAVPALVQDILTIKRPRLSLPLRRRGYRREPLATTPDIQPNVAACVAHVLAANAFRSALAAVAATAYDATNGDHEAALLGLWAAMQPGVPLAARKCAQWTDIGFQGVDPASDFRGSGELALRCLCWMARERGDVARGMLNAMGEVAGGRSAAGSVAWYPWACAGIQIVHEVRGLAEKRLLDGVWYQTLSAATAAGGAAADPWGHKERLMTAFYEVVAEVWVLFHGMWGAAIREGGGPGEVLGGGGSVLDYPRVFAEAMAVVKDRLQKRGSLLERGHGQ